MDKKILFFGLAVAVVISFVSFVFAQEQITITTYYPSPYGAYNELQTNKMAVGDVNNSGGLDAGDQPPANGQLYTARSVIYKPQSSLPAFDARKGELVYNNSDNKFYYYNGSSWVAQAGGGGCYVSYSGGCLTGFTNKGSAGWWGYCSRCCLPYACGSQAYCASAFRPPGGECDSDWYSSNMGEAYVCCQ